MSGRTPSACAPNGPEKPLTNCDVFEIAVFYAALLRSTILLQGPLIPFSLMKRIGLHSNFSSKSNA